MTKHDAPTKTLWDSFFKYLLAAVLIFIPLYPKFPLFTVPFTYVAIRAEDFLIALVWLVFFLRLLVVKKISFPKITFQFAVFFLVGLVSCLSAILITKNVQPLLVILHYARRLEYLSVFFLVYWAAGDKNTRRYYLELAILPALGVFLYGLAQIYFQAPVISTMDSESSKGIAMTLLPGVTLNSTFAGHYDLAIYLTMMMTFLVAISSSLSSWIKRLPFLGFFIALLWLFMQAGSRISIIGLILSVAVVSFYYRRYFLGLVFFGVILAFIATSPQYLDRFRSIFKVFTVETSRVFVSPAFAATRTNNLAPITKNSPSLTPHPTPTPEALRPIQQDRSTSIRVDVEWPRAMRSFYKNPFLGTGYSSISLATDNDYLRALGETGLLGFLALLALLLAIGRFLFTQVARVSGVDRLILVSALGIFVAFLTSAIFIDVFESSKIAILFWAFMGLAFSTKNT
jgi:O-antigen ligase